MAEALPDNAVRVRVAVADVDILVKRDTAINEHVRQNTTPIYTAGKTFPMLPERLSTGLTSLNFQEDRPAIVIRCVWGARTDSDLLYPHTVYYVMIG